MPEVLCQPWEESRNDVGVRVDGYSLHRDADALSACLNSLPKVADGNRPSGKSYPVFVTDDVYRELSVVNGLRYFSPEWPKYKELCPDLQSREIVVE